MDLVTIIEQELTRNPPPGIDVAYVQSFFARYRHVLGPMVAEIIAEETGGAEETSQAEVSALPEAWTAKARTAANLRAMMLLAKPPDQLTEEERTVLTGYSGWGGLSIERVQADLASLPAGVPRPDPVGLIHEYYTPSIVTEAVATSIVASLLESLPRVDGAVQALEPSAGIGRFLNAMQGQVFNELRWTACEMSPLSAAILRRLYPWANVQEGLFEGWISRHLDRVQGNLGLVLSNPPYGVRGAGATQDTDRSYGEKNAYAYFMRRSADLLAAGGVGIYLIPAGFMSGQAPAKRELRTAMLRRHHLLGAYRLPSVLPKGMGRKEALFPGALLVTDLVVFRARGGELPDLSDPGDVRIVDGYYFLDYPENLLGVELGEDGGEDDQTRRGRYHNYRVEGAFTGLPPLVPRPMTSTDVPLLPFRPAAKRARGGVARVAVEIAGLPEDLADAVRLGMRLDAYVSQIARGETKLARAGHAELVRDVQTWITHNGNPHQDAALVELATGRGVTGAQRFLAAVDESGALLEELADAPIVDTTIEGKTPIAVADWIYRQTGRPLAPLELAQRLNPGRFGGTSRGLWTHVQDLADAPEVAPAPELTRGEVAALRQLADAGGPRWTPGGDVNVFYAVDAMGDVPQGALIVWPPQPPGWTPPGRRPGFYWHPPVAVVGHGGTLHPYDAQVLGIDAAALAPYEAILRDGGWFRDYPGDGWMPPEHYLTGHLWPRVDAAMKVKLTDAQAARQVDALMAAIKPETFDDVVWAVGKKSDGTEFREFTLSPRESWLPLSLVQAWAWEMWGESFTYQRDRAGLLNIEGWDYASLKSSEEERTSYPFHDEVLFFLGWTNHDQALFRPKRQKYQTSEGEKLETLDEARLRIVAKWGKKWQDWLLSEPGRQLEVSHRYNRLMRGYVAPVYSGEPIEIARWSPDAPKPYGYQWSAVRRIQANRRGLLAFDVGLGKTFTGIATLALARQEGWVKRPVVLVPNSIIWKWYRDFQRVVPTFRVAVIGATRRVTERPPWGVEMVRPWPTSGRAPGPKVRELLDYLAGRGRLRIDDVIAAFPNDPPSSVRQRLTSLTEQGVATFYYSGPRQRMISEPDTPEERAQKWTRFAAGGYDVVLLTFSALGRTQLNVDALRDYAESTAAVKRQVKIKQRQARGAGKPTERQTAILREGTAAWLADMMEIPERWVYDPGIDWHALGIDMLMVDESQNFKNLYMPEEREGGVPDSMGAGQPSARAWQLDFRCASVRAHTGGSGIVLLSATPAKNGPVEVYNFIYLMDPSAWERIGITDSEAFIDHFCGFTSKKVILPTGKSTVKLACTGFRDLPTIRGVMDRYGEFKTAEDVGLKIPGVTGGEPIVVEMNARQTSLIRELVAEMEDLYERLKTLRGNDPDTISTRQAIVLKIQGLGMHVDMVALHPDLPGIRQQGQEVIDNIDPRAPKLEACANDILGTRLEACDTACAGPECLSCGHIVFVENIAVHTWMKRLLIAGGMPPDRIAVLNGEAVPDPEQRQQIAMAFNGNGCEGDEDYEPPAYDVVIANSVAYEGVDLQRRTCKIHHLDLPWEPATLQQRNGRGVRQGNRFESVDIRYYFARKGGDARRLAKINNKRSWLTSLFKSQDRATNNPLASETLTPEEWLEGLTENPERLREIRAAQALAERESAIAAARTNGMRALAEADSYYRRADTAATEERASLLARAEARMAVVEAIDPNLWPWGTFAQRVRQARVFIPTDGPPVFEGMWVRWDGRLVEVGAVSRAWFGLRLVGEGKWHRATLSGLDKQLPGFDRVQPGEVSWSAGVEDNFSPSARRIFVHSLYTVDGWIESGWSLASGQWQTDAWAILGADIVANLRRLPWSEPGLIIPCIDADGRLVLVEQSTRRELQRLGSVQPDLIVVPPTPGGWQQFLGAAVETARRAARKAERPTWTKCDTAAKTWWAGDYTFPTGVLNVEVETAAEAEGGA